MALAQEIDQRERTRLVGLMAYEGQIAGVGDNVPRKAINNLLIRAMQSQSAKDIEERRAEIVTALSEVAQLEFVNGGGTGSIELTAAEWAVTEVAAGSGSSPRSSSTTTAPSRCSPRRCSLCRSSGGPVPGVATALGGGYLASGVGAKDRMPVPYLPSGLRLDPHEGAGEVQTPLRGSAAEPAAGRRSRLLQACQGGRALRAIQQALPGNRDDHPRRGPDLPRRGQELSCSNTSITE